MPTNYVVEYSRSSRASCKKCKAKIQKGVVRVGVQSEHPDWGVTVKWVHPECQGMPRTVSSVSEFEGYSKLKKEDQVALAANIGLRTMRGKKKRDEAVADGESKKADIEKKYKKLKVASLKTLLEEKGLPKTGRKADLIERLIEAEVPAVPKLSDDEKKIMAIESDLASKTVAQLKEMLAFNNQLRSGNKYDLVSRIADCKMYGCLPKCPSCGGGTLRVSYQSRSGHNGQGHFSCPGYMDDDEFVRCNYSAMTATRPPWEDPN